MEYKFDQADFSADSIGDRKSVYEPNADFDSKIKTATGK